MAKIAISVHNNGAHEYCLFGPMCDFDIRNRHDGIMREECVMRIDEKHQQSEIQKYEDARDRAHLIWMQASSNSKQLLLYYSDEFSETLG